jgi:predicted Rossmann fold nucleotide-binding protein DprA/Smf involved in DNA uptake
MRAALLQAERPEAEQRNLLAAAALDGSEKKLYELLSAEEPVHIDDIVERSGLNSSEVLATLFDREMKGIIRQLPGKQFSKVLSYRQIEVCIAGRCPDIQWRNASTWAIAASK